MLAPLLTLGVLGSASPNAAPASDADAAAFVAASGIGMVEFYDVSN